MATWTPSTGPLRHSSSKPMITQCIRLTDAPDFHDCRKETSLHTLFCIADTASSPKHQYTAQGYDMQFGANVLGHLLLVRKLYHLLVSSTTPECPTRVIWASSTLHSRCSSPFNYEALRDTPARSQKFITPQTLYESSKFAVVQLALYMSRTTFKDDGVVMMIVDPRVQVESSASKNTGMKIVG